MVGFGINKLTLLVVCLTLVSLSNSFLYESYALKDEDLDAVKFYLYQRNVTREDHRARLSDIKSGSFNPSLKTYFTIHGFGGADWASQPDHNIKGVGVALLEKEDSNVFNIDWNYWSKLKPLRTAGSYTKRVGQIIAQFIKLLEQNFGVSRVDMHVIGFSLGGQVAGFTGASLSNPQLGRLTTLDSAGAGCTRNDTYKCFGTEYATFVEEIHTQVSGARSTKGQVDFYPIKPKVKLPKNWHAMAPYMYAQSIRAGNCSFLATLCGSVEDFMAGKCDGNPTNHMGFYAVKPDTKPPNRYYLNPDWNNPCNVK